MGAVRPLVALLEHCSSMPQSPSPLLGCDWQYREELGEAAFFPFAGE